MADKAIDKTQQSARAAGAAAKESMDEGVERVSETVEQSGETAQRASETASRSYGELLTLGQDNMEAWRGRARRC